MKPTLGFIGLGLMGAPMAARLLKAGFPLHLYNRTREKMNVLAGSGAFAHSSAGDAAQPCDIIVTMLTNDDALRSISGEIRKTMSAGAVHIDCSTVSPSLTSELEKEYTASGHGFLHSPVLGSIPQAADGSLLLFAGGSDEAFSRAEEPLKVLGSTIWRFPSAAQATNMKLIMNSFIGGMIATLSQALRYGEKVSVDGSTILDVLSHSALNSPMYQTKGKSILEENFVPRFFLENLLKDTNLFRNAAAEAGAASPVADAVRPLLEQAVANGYGKEDYSAIVKTV